MTNNSLKEYYIKLEKMMNNAVNMLTAITQSLSTQSPEITIDLVNTDTSTDNTTTSLRIPSYLYLENKIEQLDNIISNLFTIPKSGEAWFEKTSNMYKLSLVKSSNAPLTPEVSNLDTLGFNIKDNNIFKDLVNPKTYIRLQINNLPEYVSQMIVNKIVVYNQSDANYLKLFKTYSDVKGALFNKQLGTDYEEYESVIDLPIKADKYKSFFKIENIELDDADLNNIQYKLKLDTLTYYDKDDSSIQYILKKGDLLCLSNEYAIYRIKDIQNIYNNKNIDDSNEYIVSIEEYIGHINLQIYDENSEMYLQIYNESYNNYHYIDIPLEENPYIIVFISTIYNNIRSTYSNAIHLNLNEIYMRDSNNNYVLDESGNKIGYIEYYKKYCKNIGDLLDGISKVVYPQITNYNNGELKRLTDSDELKNFVTDTLYNNDELVLKVTRINAHLIDEDTTKNIITLHNQKNEINSQLKAVQDNVDQVYTQLTTTDFSQESSVSQEQLRSQLNEYYNERLTLEKQLISIVDNINQAKSNVIGLSDSKYRVRGITDVNDKYDSSIESPIISFLHNQFSNDTNIIGMDVEYKYKTATKDSTNVLSNGDVIFTDWNKLHNIERERYLKFDSLTNKFTIEFSNYNSTSNVVKWNQLDIPINQGEDVVVRIRYKYNIGQPFINLYTPWSNEVTVTFPTEYTETTDVSSILDDNDQDVVSAKFLKTLINNGYEEHVANKIVDNSQVFHHMPENIYSGFNTPENNYISLKDKLIEMNNEITTYKAAIDNEINTKYDVILEWDNTSLVLSNSTTNKIIINDVVNGSLDAFIKKEMNLIIKNTGSVPIKFYSLFPGNTDTPLINIKNLYYDAYVSDYERVPLLLAGSSIPSESIIPQYAGQWIYFRQNNPYTNESIYLNDTTQNQYDISYVSNNETPVYNGQLSQYINVDNKQVLLPYRNRAESQNMFNTWSLLTMDDLGDLHLTSANNYESLYNNSKYYLYGNADESNNNYILKYEHLKYLNNNDDLSITYLTNNVSISEFAKQLNKNVSNFNGAFLIPELLSTNQITCSINKREQYKLLEVGQSISIPLLFEYFLTANETNTSASISISKTLAFDLKSSLVKDPEHYILSVQAKYDYSQTLASSYSYQTSAIDGLSSTE